MKTLNDSDFAFNRPLTQEQMSAGLNFLDSLYTADVQDFWRSLADIDCARLKGVYLAQEEFHEEGDFESFLYFIRGQVQQRYSALGENYGASTTARYTSHGEVFVYMFENVEEAKVIEQETLELIHPIVLAPNVIVQDEGLVIEYKVTIYETDYRDIELSNIN